MAVQHAWPSVPHHAADPFPHRRLVAMHRTVGAGRFAFLVGAPVQTSACVVQQQLALIAEIVLGSVVSMAIDVDHRLYRPAFPVHSGMTHGLH